MTSEEILDMQGIRSWVLHNNQNYQVFKRNMFISNRKAHINDIELKPLKIIYLKINNFHPLYNKRVRKFYVNTIKKQPLPTTTLKK